MEDVTQFGGHSKHEICDLVVGLDFGTSCTKVVLRDPYRHRRGFAVPFGAAAHSSSPYLLPSVLWINGHGEASLVAGDGDVHLRDIKQHLMQDKPLTSSGVAAGRSVDPGEAAIVFLALVLRRCRSWFLKTHQLTYGSYILDWQVNIGLPSADFADKTLCHNYLQIAAAAWHLSLGVGPIRLRDAERASTDVIVDSDENGDGVDGYAVCGDECSAAIRLIPEVAAEVVGYARSHMRDQGLHVLIDIGATTLDVCAFILHEKNDDDCYELLTADVRELGTMVLHHGRVALISEHFPQHGKIMWQECDPVMSIPGDPEQYLPKALRGVTRHELLKMLREGDIEYRKDVKQALWRTLFNLRMKRDPNSRRWKEQMPLFIAGGASRMPFYRKVVRKISKEMGRMYSPCKGLREMFLAKPDGLEANVGDAAFHRLAVAWGLSFPETDIGEVTRPDEIEDIDRAWRRVAPIREIGKEVT